MASKTITLLLGIVILAVISQENEAAPPEAKNRMIKGSGAKKVLVYMWEGLCNPDNCTVEIKATLTKGDGSKVLTDNWDKAITDGNKQAVCLYEKDADKSSCDEIFNGTMATAKKVSFEDYQQIAINITRTQYGVSTGSSDMMKPLPWWKVCIPDNPCKYGGKCAPNKETYKCDCINGWEDTNCTVQKDFTMKMNMCLKDPPKPTGTDASTSLILCKGKCNGLNTPNKLGCKSFQFKGKLDGKGECKIFDVSKKFSKKELVPCNSTYFELDTLPTTVEPTTGAPGLVSSFLTILSLVFLAFLYM